MHVVQESAPLGCHMPLPLKHLLYLFANLVILQRDASLMAKKASAPSQKILGAVTVACIKRYS